MKANVATGVIAGLLMAAIYSVAAVVIYLATGGEAFSESGISLSATLAAYWVGAGGSGVVLGISLPFLQTRRRAMVIGPFIAAPAFAAIAVSVDGYPWHWDGAAIFAFVMASIIFGVYGGYVFGPQE